MVKSNYMETLSSNTEEQDNNIISEGESWSNPGEFPEFAGDQPKTSNIENLQKLLERSGFTDLRKNPQEFNAFLEQTDKADLYRYIQHINQSLREATVQERGFHDGRMFVGGMISPGRDTQLAVLNDTIDAMPTIEDDKYRSALAYYQLNALHLFPDANGRTARATYCMLRHPDFDLKENADFISHSNNKDLSDSGGGKVTDFEDQNGLSSPREYVQYSMLEALKTLPAENPEDKEEYDALYSAMESMLQNNPRRRANLVTVIGTPVGSEAKTELSSLKNNPSYQALSDTDRQRFNYALCDNNAIVSVAGLAMLQFHQAKGNLHNFLERHVKENPNLHGVQQCIINIDPDDEDYFGHCECKDWSTEDMLKYTKIAEDIKKRAA